jgi:lactaldehyde dehydrogenase/glycolaldehyde dehydrogenase
MVALLTEKFKAVKVGDPFSADDIDMGPLVEQRALESVQAKLAKAIEQGAKVLVGGNRVGNKGYFFEATLLGNCRQDMDIIH